MGVRPGLVLERVEPSVVRVLAPVAAPAAPHDPDLHHTRAHGAGDAPVLVLGDRESQ